MWSVATQHNATSTTMVPSSRRHTTPCMRFPTAHNPLLKPHNKEVTTHGSTFPAMCSIILGLCTHIRQTLLGRNDLRHMAHEHLTTFYLIRPLSRGTPKGDTSPGIFYTGCAFARMRATILLKGDVYIYKYRYTSLIVSTPCSATHTLGETPKVVNTTSWPS